MNIAYAAVSASAVAGPFINNIKSAILYPLISLMMGVALLVFLYGVFEFIKNAGADGGEARTIGKQHMIYGIVGLVVMVSAVALLNIVATTFNIPTVTP